MDASAQAAPFKVPFPRPDLIGREQDVERLHALLQQGRTAAVTPALTGQGGIGKTQLAVLYAHDKAGAYPGGVFWLDAAKDARPVVEQLGGYALEMGLAPPSAAGDTQEYYRQLALVWCGQAASRTDALLIADNVEEGAFVASELPGLPGRRLVGLGCRKLVTSRETDLPNCTEFKVDFLTPEQARSLLLKEAKRSDGFGGSAALDSIIAMLGGLPLALRLAGGLLKQPNLSLERFVAVLRQGGALRLLDERGQPLADYREGMKVSLRALLAETWSALPGARPELKDIMKALGCLPETERIRVKLLRQVLEVPADPLGLDDDPLASAVAELERRNLLERPDPEHVRLHPLVHEYAREQASPAFRADLIVCAAARLRSAHYLVGADAGELLTLLRELPMLEGLLDDAR